MFLSHFTFFEKGLSLNLEIMNSAGFSQQAAGNLQFLTPQQWECKYMQLYLAFYIGIGDPNLGPYAYVSSALLTDPSPGSWWLFILLMMFWEHNCKVLMNSNL